VEDGQSNLGDNMLGCDEIDIVDPTDFLEFDIPLAQFFR
jgi:hypothetical protein